MKKVIFIDEQKKEKSKPVEFTHKLYFDDGWNQTEMNPDDYTKVVYLGKCNVNGDMFSAYKDTDSYAGQIRIFKGHLNSGTY